jgi:hypothetical protein
MTAAVFRPKCALPYSAQSINEYSPLSDLVVAFTVLSSKAFLTQGSQPSQIAEKAVYTRRCDSSLCFFFRTQTWGPLHAPTGGTGQPAICHFP